MSSKAQRAQRPPKPHELALKQLHAHPLLGPVAQVIGFRLQSKWPGVEMDKRAYCQIVGTDTIVFNDTLKLDAAHWLGVLSLAVLVLASGGPKRLAVPSALSDLAAQLAALHWWQQLRTGLLPEHFELPPELLKWGRLPLEEIAARLRSEPPDEVLDGAWTLTRSAAPLMLPAPKVHSYAHARCLPTTPPVDAEQAFARALVDNAKRALQLQHDANHALRPGSDPHSTAARARRWLITHYPLLGSLLTQFELVEDAAVCERLAIGIAAIQVSTGEIFINPRRQLGLEQAKFVIAHEVLHAGLNHASRRHGRDAYLWNVACDFVINDWLVGMNLGIPPEGGLLFDEELRGWSADDIYLRLAADLRDPQDERVTRTFGVIIDSSGSMERDDLGKALGAVVAYSQAQGVKEVRLVYCDAQPYDEGFVAVEALASRVQVRGRGGTVLQPAVNLLQGRADFPRDCPILIITDGGCEDDLQVQRDHAFLLSPGRHLPFPTRRPVFRMS